MTTTTTATDHDYVYMFATVTDRWGAAERVPCGTQQVWAVRDRDALKPWKQMMRRDLLADRTCDSRGWRVVWSWEPCED